MSYLIPEVIAKAPARTSIASGEEAAWRVAQLVFFLILLELEQLVSVHAVSKRSLKPGRKSHKASPPPPPPLRLGRVPMSNECKN